MSYTIGNTVRLTIQFYDHSDGTTPTDVTSLTLKAYDSNQTQIGNTINVTETNKLSTGLYYYDYTIPNNPPYIYIEWSGVAGAFTDVSRDKVEINWSENDLNELPTVTLTVGTNTYITLSDANDYFNERLHSDSWFNTSENDRSKALIKATKKIDRQKIRGIKADFNQTLQFPRALYSQYYRDEYPNLNMRLDGDWVIETSITQLVLDAVCEEAFSLIEIGSSANKRRELQSQGVTSMKLGNLSETYSKGSGSLKLLSEESKELLFYYTGGSVVVR